MATAADNLAAARQWLGVPYKFGGESRQGIDCSGLTQLSAAAIGIDIPRTSEAQWAVLIPVRFPIPGDLVFFDVPSDDQAQPAHVGIVSGPGQMIDAPYTGTYVRYDPISSPSDTVMGYRRLPGLSQPPVPPGEVPVPFLVAYEDSYWVVSADLTTRVRVADPGDGSVIAALGYRVVGLDAAQMATIPVVG